MSNEKFYTPREEKANYLTHAAGVVMALVATIILIYKATVADNRWAMLAYSIFGFGMVACMLSSTLYHFVKEPKRKAQYRHFDHASIYLLIAASYSPFTLILLREEQFWGWLLFALVWSIAVVGIAISFGQLKRNSHLKTASYVIMGLVILIAFKPLIETANEKGCIEVVWWLVSGGLFYIAGAIIYATAGQEFIHAIFHLFVLLGLACHIIGASIIPLG